MFFASECFSLLNGEKLNGEKLNGEKPERWLNRPLEAKNHNRLKVALNFKGYFYGLVFHNAMAVQ
jgi:hypothetical protein